MMALLLAGQCVTWFAVRADARRQAPADVVATLFVGLVAAAFAASESTVLRGLLARPRAAVREWFYVLAAVCVGAVLVILYFRVVWRAVGVEDLSMVRAWRAAGWPVWGAVVVACVGAPVTEELAFRGYAQTRLSRVLSPREAVAVQAALFSVLHLFPWMYVSHFVIGFVLGEARRVTRSLWPGIVLHAMWNVGALLTE